MLVNHEAVSWQKLKMGLIPFWGIAKKIDPKNTVFEINFYNGPLGQ